jgi:hypothetical protein
MLAMTMPKQLTAFMLDPEMLQALREIKRRDGIPMGEQVRRAVAVWVARRGRSAKAERKRAATRKRP